MFFQIIQESFTEEVKAEIVKDLPFQFWNKPDVQIPTLYSADAICVAKGTLAGVLGSQYGSWLNEYLDNLTLCNFKFKPSILTEAGQDIWLPVWYRKEARKAKVSTAQPGRQRMSIVFTKYVSVTLDLSFAARLLTPVLCYKEGNGLNLIDPGTGKPKDELLAKLMSAVSEYYLNKDRIEQQRAFAGAISTITSVSTDPQEQLKEMIRALRESGAHALADQMEQATKNGSKSTANVK